MSSSLPIVDSPKPPPRRLTLTLPLLTSAQRVIVMALGDVEGGRDARSVHARGLVAARVTRPASRAHSLVLLDEDAGSL